MQVEHALKQPGSGMPKHDLEKLLRRYATETLTEEEHQALLTAALYDQKLFYALADKQALKKQLDDPRSRHRASEAQERSSSSPLQSWIVRGLDWLRRPANLALSGSLTSVLVAVIALGYLLLQTGPKSTEPLLTADARHSASSTAKPRSSVPAKQATPKAKTSSAQSSPGLPAEKRVATEPDRAPAASAEGTTKPEDRAVKVAPPAPREPKPELEQKASPLMPAAQSPAPTASSSPKEAQQGLASAPHPASPEAKPAEPEEEAKVEIPTELLPPLGRQKRTDSPRQEQRRAYSLYYAQAEPVRTDRDKALGDQLLAKIEAPAQVMNQPIGLRYSILKQGKEGGEAEADPTEKFEASATLKLSIEVNAPGVLYVLKRDPSRVWTVLYPGTEQKEAMVALDPRVEGRTRLMFPLTGPVTAKDQPVRTDAFILYSRRAQPDLNSIIALITGDPSQGGSRAALIDAYIQRTRRNAGLQHYLIQKMDSTKKGAPKERAVYVVDPSPDPSSPLFVEITVSQQ